MSWKDAHADALNRVAAGRFPESMRGTVVHLIDYEDESAFRLLVGSRVNWSPVYHRMVNRSTIRILKKRGAEVVVNTLSVKDVVFVKGDMELHSE